MIFRVNENFVCHTFDMHLKHFVLILQYYICIILLFLFFWKAIFVLNVMNFVHRKQTYITHVTELHNSNIYIPKLHVSMKVNFIYFIPLLDIYFFFHFYFFCFHSLLCLYISKASRFVHHFTHIIM